MIFLKVLIRTYLFFVLFFSLTPIIYSQDTEKECYQRGLEYAISGRFEEAKQEFQKGLKSDHPFVSPLKAGLDLIEDVIDNKIKKETAIYIFKGTDYGNRGMWDRAIAEFNQAIESEPDNILAYNARGSLYAITGASDEAIKDFNRVIELKPDYAKAYLNRGNVYSQLGRDDSALSDFAKALALNPRYTEAYYNRGLLYSRKGLYDEAISDYTKAISLYSKYLAAYYNRGIDYAKKGLYEQAVSDLNRVIELNPKNILVYFQKALICEMAGFNKEALDAYGIFIQSAPLEYDYQRYINLIEEAKERMKELQLKQGYRD